MSNGFGASAPARPVSALQRQLNAIAERRRRQRKRGALQARPARPSLQGATTAGTPSTSTR